MKGFLDIYLYIWYTIQYKNIYNFRSMLYFELPDAPEQTEAEEWDELRLQSKSIPHRIESITNPRKPNKVMRIFLEPEVLPEKWSIDPYWAFRLKKSTWGWKTNKLDIKINGKSISIPSALLSRILKAYKGRDFVWLDCVRFMMSITWRKTLEDNNLKEVNPEKFHWENLNPGDAIAFMNEEWKLSYIWKNGLCFHFATYIWNGMFIFKLGSVSDEFFITDLKNLKSWFLNDYPRMYTVG